jgi:hypothetical protein
MAVLPDNTAALRERMGLGADAVILIPPNSAPPMRSPHGVWAMLVSALDLAAPGHAGEVHLFAGLWIPEQPPADGLYDGDLVMRLTPPPAVDHHQPSDQAVDIEMMLARGGRWQRVGHWCGIDDRWPYVVGQTAAAVMNLTSDSAELVPPTAPPTGPCPTNRARENVPDLFRAGLVTTGDIFEWSRPNGVLHTARVCGDGRLALADGRAFAYPSGVLTAWGAKHWNGWQRLRRASDGRTLDDLRRELRGR